MYAAGKVETAETQLVPAGHCKKIWPAGEPQTCPTTSISGGAPSSAPTAAAVQSGRQLTSPEFTLLVTMQQTSPPVQSAFWSHEICTTGPRKLAGVGHVPPMLQAWVSTFVLMSSSEQQKSLPLQVALPQRTLGPWHLPWPSQRPPAPQRVVLEAKPQSEAERHRPLTQALLVSVRLLTQSASKPLQETTPQLGSVSALRQMPVTAQVWHWPAHPVLQQTPSTQLLLAHSEPAAQA
jgi:hypothetical protein